MGHWEAMLSHPNEWVEQWHILRPDADFRDVTKSSEDTLQASNSYDVTRSSLDDDGETSDEDDEERNTSSQPRPILVLPNGDNDGEEIINLTVPRKSKKKVSYELDDYEFRSLTKENTKRNSLSATSLRRGLEESGRVCVIVYRCSPNLEKSGIIFPLCLHL